MVVAMAQPDPLAPAPRRLLLLACLQVVLTTIVLTAIYYGLPLQPSAGAGIIAWLAVGVVGFAAVAAFQVRAVLHAQHPVLRAITGFGVAIPLFVLVFASTYLALVTEDPRAFSEGLSHTDALYFTVTVFATVGFGDITPISQGARIAVTIQMIGGLIVLGGLARVVVAAVQINRQRQLGSHPEG